MGSEDFSPHGQYDGRRLPMRRRAELQQIRDVIKGDHAFATSFSFLRRAIRTSNFPSVPVHTLPHPVLFRFLCLKIVNKGKIREQQRKGTFSTTCCRPAAVAELFTKETCPSVSKPKTPDVTELSTGSNNLRRSSLSLVLSITESRTGCPSSR